MRPRLARAAATAPVVRPSTKRDSGRRALRTAGPLACVHHSFNGRLFPAARLRSPSHGWVSEKSRREDRLEVWEGYEVLEYERPVLTFVHWRQRDSMMMSRSTFHSAHFQGSRRDRRKRWMASAAPSADVSPRRSEASISASSWGNSIGDTEGEWARTMGEDTAPRPPAFVRPTGASSCHLSAPGRSVLM